MEDLHALEKEYVATSVLWGPDHSHARKLLRKIQQKWKEQGRFTLQASERGRSAQAA